MSLRIPRGAKQEALIQARQAAEDCAALCGDEADTFREDFAKARFWEHLAQCLADKLPKPEPVVVRVPKEDLAQNQGWESPWASDAVVATMHGGKVNAETEKAYYCEFVGGAEGETLAWLPRSEATPVWGAQGKPHFDCVELPIWLAQAKKLDYVDNE